MQPLAYQIETDYAGAVSSLETRLSSYIEPQPNPPDGVPAQALTYFPHIFSGAWPLLAAAELPPEGGYPQSMSDTVARLRILRIGVRIYYPSLTAPGRGDAYQDGREAAKRITRMVFSNWLAKFQADDDLLDSGVISSVDMGDHDRIGNPFFQPGTEGTSILWVLAVGVDFLL